jgi:four helix bundle protein
VRTFRDLIAWQKAFALCLLVYETTVALPAHERFGLTNELRKTARSVVYNIAEGQRRGRTLEFIHFLDISRGSAAELMTQVLLANALGYFPSTTGDDLVRRIDEIERLIAGLKRSLAPTNRRR